MTNAIIAWRSRELGVEGEGKEDTGQLFICRPLLHYTLLGFYAQKMPSAHSFQFSSESFLQEAGQTPPISKSDALFVARQKMR